MPEEIQPIENPVIPGVEPYIRPQVAQKEFAESYILNLTINAKAADASDGIYVESVPYDFASKERAMEVRREIRVPLWEAVERYPSVQAAFGAIIAALPDLYAFQEERNAPPAPVEE